MFLVGGSKLIKEVRPKYIFLVAIGYLRNVITRDIDVGRCRYSISAGSVLRVVKPWVFSLIQLIFSNRSGRYRLGWSPLLKRTLT